MDLQISGKVIEVLDEQSGESKNGPWRKQDFILETTGDYSKTVCITQWGENIDRNSVKVNDELTAYIDIQSREYNGRWYSDVKAWKVEKESSSPSEVKGIDSNTVLNLPEDDDEDILPF